MGSEIFFHKIKTRAIDRRGIIKTRLDEYFSKSGINFGTKQFPTKPQETDEQRLEIILIEIANLEKEVNSEKQFTKDSVKYRKIDHACVTLQIRLDNLQIDDNQPLRQQRRNALAQIDVIKESLNVKTK